MKDRLTVNEAASYLGVNRVKINTLLRRGVLKAETNPLDARQKLVSRQQLDALKEYLPEKPQPTPVPQLNPAELEEVLAAIAESEAEDEQGFYITHEEIKNMVAEKFAAYRLKKEQASA